MGSDRAPHAYRRPAGYFNPRSRMGSDTRVPCGHSVCLYISIHAPAWGATFPSIPSCNVGYGISIHAPAWGATSGFARNTVQVIDFNPRSRMGSDTKPVHLPAFACSISIHAPAWGATDESSILKQHTGNFNPRSRMGSDRASSETAGTPADFNPRSRMGSDWSRPPQAHGSWDFNPRSRMGSDRRIILQHAPPLRISIHAPAWGATASITGTRKYTSFQSTLPHGERHDPPHHQPERHRGISIHAPAWGATRCMEQRQA